MSAIKKGAFSNMPVLKYIMLTNNQLTFLEQDTFFNLPLEILSLDRNNLQFFDQDWYNEYCFVYLQRLSLKYNYIESIPKRSFTNLKNLWHIDMSHNQITHIHENAFEGLMRLSYLHLSSNKISHLAYNVLEYNSGLNGVNLYGNNLTHLSDGLLQRITKLPHLTISYHAHAMMN